MSFCSAVIKNNNNQVEKTSEVIAVLENSHQALSPTLITLSMVVDFIISWIQTELFCWYEKIETETSY